MGEGTQNHSWNQRVAAACVIAGLGGAALVDYKPPYQLPQYYAIAVIVVGLGAGVFLDHPGEGRILRRALMAMVPASMPLIWLGHCLIIGGACANSGAPFEGVALAFMWLALTLAILIGSFAWPVLLNAVEYMTGSKVSTYVDRMTRLVTKIGTFLTALGLLVVKYVPQLQS